MEGIVPELRWSAKERLIRQMRHCSDAKRNVRYLIIVNLLNGRTVVETVGAVQVGRSTVYDVARRFRERGEAGLIDGREENGDRKLDERYLATLYEVVQSSPQDHRWRRPTWTREMLVDTLRRKTGVRINVATMSIALKTIGARRGRPKPSVKCPWSKRAKDRRLREIQQLLRQLPPDEVAVYEDEVDIHLNPKIGLDWMVTGQQKEVVTPGQNQKSYLAGAQDVRKGEVIWVEGDQKKSILFICLLWELLQRFPDAKTIHVILDNYSSHKKNGDWLAAHPTVFFRFTPTSASWLNQVENWFGIFTRKARRGASFNNIEQLREAIEAYIEAYRRIAKPFIWRKREVKESQLRNTLVNLCK